MVDADMLIVQQAVIQTPVTMSALITFPRLNGDLTTSNFCFLYLTVKVKYVDADVFP
jgi:hypothetical protein